MASAGSIDPHNIQTLVAKTKTLINAQLKSVLRAESLPVSGAKAVMQERIINLINHHVQTGDVARFNRLRDEVNSANASSHNTYNTSSTPPQHNLPTSSARPPASLPSHISSSPFVQGAMRIQFRDSPFFNIIEPLTPTLECKVRESTRDNLDCKINLRQDTVDRLSKDSSLKVMVYCASEPMSPFNQVDISFPHSIEIRINLDEIKSNLRGLKNKPGSTRPADITPLLRKRAGYDNSMRITYALTNKKFYILVNLVKQHQPEDLVAKLNKRISKEQVIHEMISKNLDSDVVATSSILSLKCPISTQRFQTPCRSTICLHNQCFDALAFLQLQEQAPTWTCPVCNKVISFQALQMDEYVNDILKCTPRSTEQVTIEPDGKWSEVVQKESVGRSNGAHSSSDEDDDLIEIQDMPRVSAIKDEALLTPSSMARTPPHSSREQSFSSAAPRSISSKRPMSQVIDLTFSSDEEDQPSRGPKRQTTQPTSTGYLHSYISSGMLSENTPPRPNGINFNIPKLAPTRQPEPLDHGFGSS